MNHYESREIGNRKDDLALARVGAIDPEGLFRTVLSEDISMCGFLPATALLFAAPAAKATRARVVALADSERQTGDALASWGTPASSFPEDVDGEERKHEKSLPRPWWESLRAAAAAGPEA